jgi:YesN/AraC family two-component response regulator
VTAGDIGTADYLVKPVSEEQIQEIVQQAIARLRRWRRSLSDTLWRTRSAV